jgi:hypothetical protein
MTGMDYYAQRQAERPLEEYEKTERSLTIFDSSMDRHDRDPVWESPEKGSSPSPELVRLGTLIDAAWGILSSKRWAARQLYHMRVDIRHYGLSAARLSRLFMLAQSPSCTQRSFSGVIIDDEQVPNWRGTYGQRRTCALLVARGALSLLAEVPLQSRHDLSRIIDMAQWLPGALPRDASRALSRRLTMHLADVIAGRPFKTEGSACKKET